MPSLARLARPFVDWLARTDPARREIVLATVFLAALMATGTFGYVLIEGWYWLDGLYMTFITLTTIGFSEVNKLSSGGRIFTILIGLVGIGAVAFIATRAAQIVLASELISKRHMKKRIEALQGHYIVCGYGRIGKRIAQDLHRAGERFVVVEIDDDAVEELVETHYLFVHGNAEHEDVLQRAGIAEARGLILTLPDDSSNVFVTLTARELKPGLFVLARTDTHHNERKLRRAGADKVVAAYEIGADRMAQVILKPHVDRFMEDVLLSESINLIMEEIKVGEGAPLAQKTLVEGNFRQNFNTIVVAIVDGADDRMHFNPSADTRIKSGDVLIVLGSPMMIEKLRQEGCSS